jgi:hypothetical protein
MAELLPLFTRLRKLTLFGVNWTSLGPEIRKLFRRVLILPTLIHLELLVVTFDRPEHLEDLLHSHLKRLKALSVKWESGINLPQSQVDEEIEPNERQPCHLEYLNFSDDWRGELVDWLLGTQNVLNLTNLRILDVCSESDGDSFLELSRMIQSLRSLEHLFLHDDEEQCMPLSSMFCAELLVDII